MIENHLLLAFLLIGGSIFASGFVLGWAFKENADEDDVA